MFTFPRELITQKYYKTLNINDKTPLSEANKSLRKLYHEYHQTQFNLDILYQQIRELSICYDIINDPEKKKIYDTYGDYIIEKIVDPEHFDNNFLNHTFRGSDHGEPFSIELSLEKMNTGDEVTVKYQFRELSKKTIDLEVKIPKKSKSNDLISVTLGKEKINIFLKQKKDSRFLSFGYNLLYTSEISLYDILLGNTFTFSNLYGNKLSFEMSKTKLWTLKKFDNQGLSSNNPNNKHSLFLFLNIINPDTQKYNSRTLLHLLKSPEYFLTELDIINLINIIFKNDVQSEKINPLVQKKTKIGVQKIMELINKESNTNQYNLCQRLLFTIINNLKKKNINT